MTFSISGNIINYKIIITVQILLSLDPKFSPRMVRLCFKTILHVTLSDINTTQALNGRGASNSHSTTPLDTLPSFPVWEMVPLPPPILSPLKMQIFYQNNDKGLEI